MRARGRASWRSPATGCAHAPAALTAPHGACLSLPCTHVKSLSELILGCKIPQRQRSSAASLFHQPESSRAIPLQSQGASRYIHVLLSACQQNLPDESLRLLSIEHCPLQEAKRCQAGTHRVAMWGSMATRMRLRHLSLRSTAERAAMTS